MANGRYKHGNYIMVLAPDNYPGTIYVTKKGSQLCLEHHLVYWQNTGITPKKDELIHHKDTNGYNNIFSNLKLKKRVEHSREHMLEKGTSFTELTCSFCGAVFHRETRRIKWQIKQGQTNFYCNRKCMGKAQGRITGKKDVLG